MKEKVGAELCMHFFYEITELFELSYELHHTTARGIELCLTCHSKGAATSHSFMELGAGRDVE